MNKDKIVTGLLVTALCASAVKMIRTLIIHGRENEELNEELIEEK